MSQNNGLFDLHKYLLSLVSLAFILTACGGGGSGDGSVAGERATLSYTVSTNAGANGAINPGSATVDEGATTSFTVTPDAGYLIGAVSGCGGSLSGDTYTTGAISADCTVTASFVARMLGAASALFPNNGANWNDYVAGGDWSTATDTACNAATDSSCLNGGERRIVVATGKSDCTGLTAADELGAFEWVCDAGTGTARFISTGFAKGKGLADLIDFATPGFKADKVAVYDNGALWATTPSTSWWANPVALNNAGGSLDTASTIYLVTSDAGAAYTFAANKAALVIQPGVSLSGPATHTNVVTAIARNYLWVEGAIAMLGDEVGVNFDAVHFSMVHNLTVTGGGDAGVALINSSSHNTLLGVTANKNNNGGIKITNSSNNTLTDITAINNNQRGVYLETATNNTLTSLRLSANGSYGLLLLTKSAHNMVSDVVAANNTYGGIALYSSQSNIFQGITAMDSATTSTTSAGVVLWGASNNIFSGVTASNNDDGVAIVNNSYNNLFLDVTVTNNAADGVVLYQESGNALSTLAVSNNNAGVSLLTPADNTVLVDVAAANNPYAGIYMSGASNNRFSGVLKVGANGVDCNVTGGTNPGLDNNTCANNGTSDASLTTGIALANAFMGKVMNDDSQNASDSSGVASYPVDAAALDWTHFDNAFRAWGIDGSAFPNADQQGQWTTGTGRIWDWSLYSGDNGDGGGPALLGALTLPGGSETMTWYSTTAPTNDAECEAIVAGATLNGNCQSTYLRHAVEIMGDGVGNDNLLCESNETCLYTPNIGSYQGHGKLISAGTYSDSSLTGITLLKYESNGY